MQVSDLQRMFDYDHWANCEIPKAMKATATVPEKTVGRMAHVLSAGKLWLERILGEKQSMAVWPGSTIADCERLADEMAGAWRNYLAQFARDQATLDQIIHYKNTKGELWSSRVEDVLIHVIMHSMYHRGQIALELRNAGTQPPYTDFIHAVRQGQLTDQI